MLMVRALETTLAYVGQETSFAGFMLVAFAALFLTLSVDNHSRQDSKSRRIPGISAPIAFALIVQLLFIPILWTHQSDDLQILGRFSYGFGLAVSINLCAVVILLALLWRHRMITDLLNQRDGLMKYCGCVLLIVCLLFAMTQVRSIHYRASSYLFLTALSLLLMIGGLLASLADEPRIHRLFLLSICVTAGALLTLAVLVSVEMVLVRFINRRSIASVVFALMLAGMMNGVALGALICRVFHLTQTGAVWLRRVRLLCLITAFTIAAGIVIGQAWRISYLQQDVALWESQHQEIIRLRDEGDPAVFTKLYARLIPSKMDHRPPPYNFLPLGWPEKIFYGLDYEDAFS